MSDKNPINTVQRRQASAQYREFLGESEKLKKSSLQTALDTVLQTDGIANDVAKRSYEQSDRSLLLNHVSSTQHYLFGELVSYKTDGLIALIKKYEKPTAALDIRQSVPKAGHDHLHGLFYFLTIGNHVLVLESSRVRTKAFQEYLSWFLSEKSEKFLDQGHTCSLKSEMVVQMDDDDEVTSATFAPLGQHRAEARKSASQAKDIEQKTKIWEKVMQAPDVVIKLLKAAGATDASINRTLEEIPADAKLEAELKIRARTRQKLATISPKLINDLFNVSSDDSLVLQTPDGKRVGEIGTLRHPVRIELEGDLMLRSDVERALYEAYTVFVKNGRISPAG